MQKRSDNQKVDMHRQRPRESPIKEAQGRRRQKAGAGEPSMSEGGEVKINDAGKGKAVVETTKTEGKQT